MGTWGIGIFDDDLASDVRTVYLDIIAAGAAPDVAAQQTQARFTSSLDDSDESVVFWIALAAIQIQFGSVSEDIRKQALEVIVSGQDEKRWSEAPTEDQQARQRIIQELKEKLTKTS